MLTEDTLMAFAGGAGMYLAPVVCLRAMTMPGVARTSALLHAGMASVALIACLMLVFAALPAAAAGFILAAAGRALLRRERTPDFVVEGALLGNSLSPQLAAELEALEAAARDGHLQDVHPPVLRRADDGI